MAKVLARYVGNLHEIGKPGSNLDSFVVETDNGKDAAVDDLTRQALAVMEQKDIAAATLRMTANGVGIGTRDLENPKYARWT